MCLFRPLPSPWALQTGSQEQMNEEISEEPPPTVPQARDRFQASEVRVLDGAPSPAELRATGQLATLLSLLQGRVQRRKVSLRSRKTLNHKAWRLERANAAPAHVKIRPRPKG